RRDRPVAGPRLRLLRPAYAVRPLPVAPPAHTEGARDAAAVLPEDRQCTQLGRARSDGGVPAHGQPRLPALLTHPVHRRHPARAVVVLLPAGFAAGLAGINLPALRRYRAAVEVLRRHRRQLDTGALARLADPLHQRALQRDRAVAEDPR